MHDNCPGSGKKLFLVRTESTTSPKIDRGPGCLLDLIGNPLLPLALAFCGTVFLAASLWMHGQAQGARDFLLIFLPPLCVLLGAASPNHFRG